MSKIYVSGLANIETSCAVDSFPIAYQPIDYNFFGITSVPSGVGLNVALALTALGDEVSFATFTADDAAGDLVRLTCREVADCRFVPCSETPQSVVLFAKDGSRRIYTDLKDMQKQTLPDHVYADLDSFDAFCLCNIGYSRGVLSAAKATGKPVFTDVHCLSDVYDGYNSDFMRCSNVLFLSNESILDCEEDFVRQLADIYPCRVIVVGMGSKGALLFERGSGFTFVPSVYTRKVVNTVGAGDALFSSFTHFYVKGDRPVDALKKAAVFASYKIGESGASKGFLSETELMRLIP